MLSRVHLLSMKLNIMIKNLVADHVRIWKYNNVVGLGYTPNWLERVFVIKKVKNTVPWTCVIENFHREEIVGTFNENKLKKTNQTEFRIQKVL